MYIIQNKEKIFNFLKWLSLPLVLAALYYQLFVKTDFSEAIELFKNGFSKERLPYFIIVLLLMPVNLGTEALKWQLLLKKTHHITFLESLKSIFAGISLSIFTPKRVGEYAGRLILLKGDHLSAAGSLFVGNFAQTIANLIFGLLSIIIFYRNYAIELEGLDFAIPIALVLSIVLIIGYFSLDKVYNIVKEIPFIKKYAEKLSVVSTYSNRTLFALLALSFIKYLIFVFQFVLLLYAFGIEMDVYWAFVAASCVFFVKTMLPVPASVELAARGSIAIYFFSFFTDNHIGILVASILLWVINLAIPAIVGSYFISNTRL